MKHHHESKIVLYLSLMVDKDCLSYTECLTKHTRYVPHLSKQWWMFVRLP